MTKPTFKEWLASPSNYTCNVYVKRKDGTEQYINGCKFSYGLSTGREMITKMGDEVKDFFFVDSILSVDDISVEA